MRFSNLEVPLGPGREFDPELADVHYKPESFADAKERGRQFHGNRVLKLRAISSCAASSPKAPASRSACATCVSSPNWPAGAESSPSFDLNAQSLVIGEHLEFDSAK